MSPRSRAVVALLVVVTTPVACESAAPPGSGASDAGASPNAKILPVPLATEPPDLGDGGPTATDDSGAPSTPPDAQGHLGAMDAGSLPAENLRPALPMVAEAVPVQRETSGVAIDAVFRWRDVPAPAKAAEVSVDAIREAMRLATFSIRAEMSEAGRLRVELTGTAFPFPVHTEIRARSDRFGSLLFWPSATEYRVIPPGALRTVLGERRVDVTPLSSPTLHAQGEGKRLGLTTRRIEIGSNVGTVKLELARVPEAGEGGMALCRMLVELGGIEPRTVACQSGDVPLLAAFNWQEGGGIAFEVTALARRSDLPVNQLLAPPPSVPWVPAGLPAVADGLLISRETLAAFRTAPVAPPQVKDGGPPEQGLVAQNRSDRLMYLLVDGVPVVVVPPGAERHVTGALRGRYLVQWRTFLGEKVAPAQVVAVPCRTVYGSPPDAGGAEGG